MWGRVIIAGVIAGLAAFGWGGLSHGVLGITDGLMKPLPNEDLVLTALRQNVLEPGIYAYPDVGMAASRKGGKSTQDAAGVVWERAFAEEPHGLVVLTLPTGQPFNMRPHLLTQLGFDIACAVLAAVLLMLASPSLPSFWARVLFVASLGLFAAVQIDGRNWIWWGFPGEYFRASALDALVEWLIAGLVLAAVIRRPKAT